ncbi:MAG: hypothetical protein RIB93_24890 [Coleofasciculus sp. D1-CHI-01]|uniref:hypothetical protein n=1 Tax=Coleofasciculus sp. D1-CHI-01 TaxID=3068482 RepID=UPI0032FEA974
MKFIHRTIPLLGLTAILITPITARAVQNCPIDAVTLKDYIAQTTPEDFIQQGIQQLKLTLTSLQLITTAQLPV